MITAATHSLAEPSAWGKELKAMLALSWPIVLTNLAQNALTTIDVMLTGRLGAHALAAGALGTNLYFALLIFGIGVLTATSPMIANTLGRKKHAVRDVRRTFRQGMWVIVALSIPVWIILWHAEQILVLLWQKPDLAHDAGAYVRALQWSYFPSMIYVLARSFVATLERPAWALVVSLLALPINLVVGWCLMFGTFGLPALGLVGVGYATCVASVFMAVAMLVVVLTHQKFRRYHLLGRFWRADWPRFFAIWRLGLPIGMAMVFEVAIFNISAFSMGKLGTEELAAHVIALQIASSCFMVPVGLGQAATIRVGLANGAGDRAGVARAGSAALVLALGFAALTALMMVSVPELLISCFIDITKPENAKVIPLAISFLVCAAIFQFGDGTQVVGASLLRGVRDTKVPMLIAAVGYCGLGLPLGLGLAFLTPLRGVGIWTGLATALSLVAVAMLWRWTKRLQRL